MLDATSLPQRGRSRSRSQPNTTASISMPSTPSAPIQIPTTRRTSNYVAPTNFSHTVSPDAVFEMSPVTSEFAGPPPPSFSLAQNDRKSESFLYTLPSFATRQNLTIPGQYNPIASGSGPTLSGSATRNRVSDPLAIKRGPRTSKSSLALNEYELSFGLTTSQDARTKTCGFSPMRESRDTIDQYQNQRLERLSPGPRLAAPNPSPWLFPGRGDEKEEDVAYSQTDPSAFEFQRHLLDRIASQNPSRIRTGMRSYT